MKDRLMLIAGLAITASGCGVANTNLDLVGECPKPVLETRPELAIINGTPFPLPPGEYDFRMVRGEENKCKPAIIIQELSTPEPISFTPRPTLPDDVDMRGVDMRVTPTPQSGSIVETIEDVPTPGACPTVSVTRLADGTWNVDGYHFDGPEFSLRKDENGCPRPDTQSPIVTPPSQ